MFVIVAVVAAGLSLLDAFQLGLLSVVRHGGTIPLDLAQSQDLRQRVLTSIGFAIEIAAIAIFLVWLYRVSKNTWAIAADEITYTPGWAVGWFFVPIAGLVMPYNVVHELWRANSNPLRDRWGQSPNYPILRVWWAACLAMAVIHYDPLQVALGRWKIATFPNYPDLNTSWVSNNLWAFFWGRLLVDIITIAWAVLNVIVVVRLTNLQKQRWAASKYPPTSREAA